MQLCKCLVWTGSLSWNWLTSEILSSQRQPRLAAILRCNINSVMPDTPDWKCCPCTSAMVIWSSHRCVAAEFPLKSMCWIVAKTEKIDHKRLKGTCFSNSRGVWRMKSTTNWILKIQAVHVVTVNRGIGFL